MNLNEYAARSHDDSNSWWHDADGNRIERNKGELLMFMVSENHQREQRAQAHGKKF